MKTYNVQKRVETNTATDIYNIATFDNLADANIRYKSELSIQETYAGEYNEGKYNGFISEYLEIESFDSENEEFEEVKSTLVYYEGVTDKNNYKGNYANNYWTIAKHDGTNLIYNFYDNSIDLNLEYPNIAENDLIKWFNYKR